MRSIKQFLICRVIITGLMAFSSCDVSISTDNQGEVSDYENSVLTEEQDSFDHSEINTETETDTDTSETDFCETDASETETLNPEVPISASLTSASAVVVSATEIKITWNDHSTDELGFKVYRGKTGQNSFSISVAVPDADVTSYSDSDLKSNTQYL